MAKKERPDAQFVLLTAWVLVDPVDKLLEIENEGQVRQRTVEQIVCEEVQTNLESVWYVRQARVRILRRPLGDGDS